MSDVPSPAPDSFTLRFVNDPAVVERLLSAFVEAAERHGYSKASRFAVRLALQEGIVNAFRHGHKNLPATATVEAHYDVSPAEIRLWIHDSGPGFDPGSIPDPTLDENLETPSGRGIMLMRAYMSRVTFNAQGNRVEMVYTKPKSPAGAA